MSKISRVLNGALFFCKKNADRIELVIGGVCIAAGTVKLINDAHKIVDVQDDLDRAKRFVAECDEEDGWKDMDETRAQYVAKYRKQTVIDFATAAGPGIILNVIGLIFMGLSNATIHKQLEAVAASLAATTTSFNTYRQRVVEDQGAEKDYQYLTGGSLKTIEMKEDGTVVETTIPVNTGDEAYIPHSFMIDESNDNWTNNAKWNRQQAETILHYVNQALATKGVLTENYIRKQFGASPTVQGQAAGVFYENPDGTTNQITIGIDGNTEAAQRFRDGLEPNFLAIITYSDGKPISNNIFDDQRIYTLGWSKY